MPVIVGGTVFAGTVCSRAEPAGTSTASTAPAGQV
jgi:hypothetical protein